MPKIIFRTALVLILLAMIPPMLIARARVSRSTQPRIHIMQDMDNQPKYKAQQATSLFADGRVMRPAVVGTVARGRLDLDDHYERGLTGTGIWAVNLPDQVALSLATLRRGQERYEIYCTPCHASSGNGEGIVHQRALVLMERGDAVWVQPSILYDEQRRVQPIGQIYNTITHGIRNMPAYRSQIPTDDRWAIAAYVKALQQAQFADWNDVPADEIERLRQIEAEQQAANRRARAGQEGKQS